MAKTAEEKISYFFSQFPCIQYKKKETILRAEDSPQGVYYLAEGYVRMYMLTSDGAELTLNIFKPGNIFPLAWAFEQIPNEYFFETMSECAVFRSPVENFLDFIKSEGSILFELARSLANKLERVHKRIQYLTMGDSSTKVINVFLMLGRRVGEVNKNVLIINIPVTHQDIANLSGLTRETVGIEIKKLRKRGLISMKNRLYILKDLDELQGKAEVNKVIDENLVPLGNSDIKE